MYRLVVAENSNPTDGKFVEIVGNYNSLSQDQPLSIQKERVEYWISKGAQPSNTVAKLLNSKAGFSLPVETRNRPPKKQPKVDEPKPAAPAEKPSDTAEQPNEAPSEPVATPADAASDESPAEPTAPQVEDQPAEPTPEPATPDEPKA